MIKFFITLYLSVLLGIIVVVYSVIILPDYVVAAADQSGFEEKIYKGTFVLLNESIKGLSKQQVLEKKKEYQTHFPPLFDLVKMDSIQFSDKELKLLKQQHIVVRKDTDEIKKNLTYNDEPRLFYYKVPDVPLVWQIYPDFSISIQGTVLARRMIAM